MYQSTVPEAFVDDIHARITGRWREVDERAAPREWVAHRRRPAWHRSSIRVSTSPPDRSFLAGLWEHFTAANDQGLPLAALEIEGVNRYRSRGYCSTHRDDRQYAGADSALLSMTLVMSSLEEYEGGELVVHDPDGPTHHLRPDRGGVVVFPSTWRHGVTPITAGMRDALIARATTLTPAHNPAFRCGMEPPTGMLGFLPHDPGEWGRKYREQQAYERAATAALREGRPLPDRWGE